MTYQVVQGDARRIPLADGSVHCCITSPPYYGLRDYGVPGQLGLEKTPAEYVARMVEAFREVRRVLRDDGTLWLNIGDSYAGSWGNQGRKEDRGTQRPINGAMISPVHDGRYPSKETNTGAIPVGSGLKPKDLIGIPWRVAFALQADGWYLRSDIIWHKPNPMPESVTDRPTKAHEYLFLLSKSPTYYYDADAVAEPSAYPNDDRKSRSKAGDKRMPTAMIAGIRPGSGVYPKRNLRSVWTIATKPYKGAHFAVMPPALVRPCILAGTSERGCCPTCGAPWRRVAERDELPPRVAKSDINRSGPGVASNHRKVGSVYQDWLDAHPKVILGWEPSCPCPPHDPQPCTVLDPFGGAMTTLVVAETLGRRGIGVELSRPHCARGKRRLDRPHARPELPADTDEPLPLFA